jgi:hypothetical protein
MEAGKKKSKTVELVKTSYQPTKAEQKEEFQVNVTMEEIGKALTQDVKIRWIDKPRSRGR